MLPSGQLEILRTITDHCRLNKHISRTGLTVDTTCRFCKASDDARPLSCDALGTQEVKLWAATTSGPPASRKPQLSLLYLRFMTIVGLGGNLLKGAEDTIDQLWST